ncbi:unnamed protein product [Spirodela intermedia]|uniref:Aspergillus nuclease S1 n=1 Tax=Spirodela intermedia TaxID=51605 RepID=A0A7I8J5F2_SPIIN|nr:unnamed protein product [Spirodela intermedia]CAA6665331.1 unnamed protein product [Spirodela intermedia]
MPGEKMGTASSPREVLEELLPDFAHNDLGNVCSWPDRARYWLPWSTALHYVNTPDLICGYDYDRDCRDAAGTGEKGMCVSGAVKNYTDQLLRHRGPPLADGDYNLTQSLLFLSHFMADIHQPLHAGFSSDKGGSTIEVHWFSKKSNLHSVWDEGIIETAKQRFYNNSVEAMIQDIDRNITGVWADQVPAWLGCSSEDTCPDVDAAESVRVACDWAYRNATNGTALGDDYFLTRLPVVYMRLAQAGVRLAFALNNVLWDADED